MKKAVLSFTKNTLVKAPPVIPPPVKPATKEPEKKQRPLGAGESEVTYVIKLIPEYRENDRSRLILELVSLHDRRKMPKIKIRPGMFVKLTIVNAADLNNNGGVDNVKK